VRKNHDSNARNIMKIGLSEGVVTNGRGRLSEGS
jgi:hypothetical protein